MPITIPPSLRRPIVFVLTTTVVATAARAAPADDRPLDAPYWRTNIFKRFAQDQKFLVTTWWPQEFKRPMFTGPLLGAIFIAANSKADGGGWDPVQQSEFESDRNPTQVQIAHGFTTFANSPVVLAALGVTYLASRRAGNDRMAETASLSTEALMSVGLYTIVLKQIAARTRPGYDSRGAFFQYSAPRNGSFPSGHAAVAFSVATVFAEEFRNHHWVPWVAYGTATLVAASRVALGQHYPSDVLFGATLGHSIAEAVVARQGAAGEAWYDRLTPYYDTTHRGYGIAYTKHW